MTHIAQTLKCTLQIQEDLLADDKVLSNVAKFCQMAADAVLQGMIPLSESTIFIWNANSLFFNCKVGL